VIGDNDGGGDNEVEPRPANTKAIQERAATLGLDTRLVMDHDWDTQDGECKRLDKGEGVGIDLRYTNQMVEYHNDHRRDKKCTDSQ
jgi:hypothetical protein